MKGHATDDGPLVSVIIPAYNCAAFIGEALSSVAQQQHKRVEAIVVDDGSTDSTIEVVERFAEHAAFPVACLRQENLGVSAARNAGLDHAQGHFVAMLDADDYFLPSKLERQIAYLNANRRVDVVHSGWNVVTHRGDPIRTVEPWVDAPNLNLRSWLAHKSVLVGALMFRREVLVGIGGFEDRLRQAEDIDLVLRLSLQGYHFGWLRESTFCYRRHQNSVTHSRALEQAECLQVVLDRFFNDPRVPASLKKAEKLTRHSTSTWVAWHCFRMGHAEVAKPMVLEAFSNSVCEPHLTLLHMMSQFVKWSEADGAGEAYFRELRAWFRDVFAVGDLEWEATLRDLDSYLKVWRYYLEDRGQSGAAKLRECPEAVECPGKLDFFISFSQRMTDPRVIRDLWNDAVQQGIVNADDYRSVTSLHLSLLGRALWEKSYATAARSVLMACSDGIPPLGMAGVERLSPEQLPISHQAALRGLR